MVIDLCVGGLVGVVLLSAGFVWDSRLAERDERIAEELALNAEMLENVRFIRSAIAVEGAPRPFTRMYLRNAPLGGLDLSCDPDQDETSCADFRLADMREVTLTASTLSGAVLRQADLQQSDFRDARLSSVDLIGANLQRADFTNASVDADLRGAKLDGAIFDGAMIRADLRGADLSEALIDNEMPMIVCYDESTDWPRGYDPPPHDLGACSTAIIEYRPPLPG